MNGGESENPEKQTDGPELQQQQEKIDSNASDRLNTKITGFDKNKDWKFQETDLDDLKKDNSWIVREAGNYIENNNVNVVWEDANNFKDPSNKAEARWRVDENGNILDRKIAFNKAYMDELKVNPSEYKADISHEVGHLKRQDVGEDDEVQAWLDEAQSGYASESTRNLCFRADGQQKTYNEIKEELMKSGYTQDAFAY